MPFILACPQGHRLKVPKKHAGRTIACPVCGEQIGVPALPDHEDRSLPQPAPAPLLRPVREPIEDATPGGSVQRAAPNRQEHSGPLPIDALLASLDRPAAAGVEILPPTPEQSLELASRISEPGEAVGTISVIYETPREVLEPGASQRFDDEQRSGVWLLGGSWITLALLCAIPSLLEHVQAAEAQVATRDAWTYLVLLATTVQVAVATYAIRIPDWSTSWVASLFATACAGFYAIGLALTMFASEDHALVRSLGLLDEMFHQRAQLWCFLVTCVTLILAYCYGRFSLRWYQTQQRLSLSRTA